MQTQNIAGYKFISLDNLSELRSALLVCCNELNFKGTILLSPEGININLAGSETAVTTFQAFLRNYDCFADITFKNSFSKLQPFKRLKVKIKKEIITLRMPEIQPEITPRAAHINPHQLKQWLDENRDITVLDTRNDYEIEYGTFEKATHLNISDFCEFPEAAKKLNANKPVVMFCTGGIRCEKAAHVLLNEGFQEVYQLDGGILNYFSEVGGAHYQGNCFVFDERVALDSNLQEIGLT